MNKIKKYNEYLEAYKSFYGPNNNDYIDINSDKGQSYNAANWVIKTKPLLNNIEKFGTLENQKKQEEKEEIDKEIDKEYNKFTKAYRDYHYGRFTGDIYDYKGNKFPADYWARKAALLENMINERKKENERDKEVKKEELGLMGMEDKLSKTYRTYLKNLPIQIEQERKAASKANIKNITGLNVKEKVVALESLKK